MSGGNFAAVLSDDIPRSEHPGWVAPALAVLTDERFSDTEWIFERKLDGERVLAFRDGDRVRLLTRNGNDVSETYPELAEAIAGQEAREFVVDGEVVAFDGAVTSFSRLQGRMQIRDAERARGSGVAVYFYLFDILHLEGRDLRGLPLRRRKSILSRALNFEDPIRFTPHRNAKGEAFFEEACAKGWEGILAKRADAPYPRGRSRDWLKFKCAAGQELVIGGFTEPEGSRAGFGALLVGYYEEGKLRYAGKVGTGFDEDFLTEFREELDRRRIDASPFADDVGEDAAWVEPDLVAEIGFTEWTSGGKLRHPTFRGLRRDKAARDVFREAAG